MKNKIDSLQVIRALAFLGIFTSHSGITMFSAGGAWGVSVFFILSGFLMVYSYYDTDRIKECGLRSGLKFGINKVKKLYPLHIVTLLIAMPYLIVGCIDYPGMGRIINPTVKTLTNALLVQSWFPSSGIYFSLNAVSWYLSVSLFLYIMFPFILSWLRRYKGIKTAIIIIAVTFAIQIIMAYISSLVQVNLTRDDDFIHWFAYIFPLSRLEDFVIGCNLGYIFIHSQKDHVKEAKHRGLTWLEIGIIVIIAVQWVAYVLLVNIPEKVDPSLSANHWWSLTVLWTITSCALVYVFALNQGYISKLLTNKVVLFIGNFSANAFLIHQMVYRYLNTLENKLFGDTYNYINIFVCFILTMISAYVWEKIMVAIKNKSKSKQ